MGVRDRPEAKRLWAEPWALLSGFKGRQASLLATCILEIAQLSNEVWIEMSPRLPLGLYFFHSTRLVVGNDRLAIVNAQREIENSVFGQPFATLRSDIAFEKCVIVEAFHAVVRDNAEKKTARLINGFPEDFLPVFANGNLLFVEPDEEPRLLKLADDVTRDFQIGTDVADEDATWSAMFFTMGFIHKVEVASGRRMFLPPAVEQLGDKVERVGREDADLFGEPAEVDDNFVALAGIEFFENEDTRGGVCQSAARNICLAGLQASREMSDCRSAVNSEMRAENR